MNSRSDSSGFGLLIASIVLFGGLAVVLYWMGLTEVAVVPTIAAVAAAAVAVVKAVRPPATPEELSTGTQSAGGSDVSEETAA